MNLKLSPIQLFTVSFFVLCGQLAFGGSEYRNYSDLSSSEQEGKDFEITSIVRNSTVLVMAIHGGKIEFGTTEIANSIAGTDWSYYSFSGLKKVESDNWSLHLTSSNFDEPRALSLARLSTHCISVHAYKNAQIPTICIGGNNTELGLVIANYLNNNSELGLKVEYPCLRFQAKKKQNIVNQCIDQGVQLEISVDALDEIKKTERNYESFVGSIRNAIEAFLRL
ncbi:MAG: poly-gamma-glutamate hydrolase family protein [Bdellovibrionia bacterium]